MCSDAREFVAANEDRDTGDTLFRARIWRGIHSRTDKDSAGDAARWRSNG